MHKLKSSLEGMVWMILSSLLVEPLSYSSLNFLSSDLGALLSLYRQHLHLPSRSLWFGLQL